jgi:hypothetical protein
MLATQRKTEYTRIPVPQKRVVKMDGNVAYINTGYPENEALRKRNAAKQKAQAAAVKAKHTRKGLVSTITVIFIAFCALALLVSRYAAICTIDSENDMLKSDIDAIKVKTEDIRVQMELRDNLESVLDTAVNDLGMKYPGEEQRVHLDMS